LFEYIIIHTFLEELPDNLMYHCIVHIAIPKLVLCWNLSWFLIL